MAEAAPVKVRMGEITAGEARVRYAANPVVLLPLGSHEDHGPHAPMGDYLLAERMAERIARRAIAGGTDCVVAPVLPFGRADVFAPMPGGIALSTATFRAVLDDMLAALLRHGFTRIVVLNGHGGNVEPIREATREVWQTHRVLVPCFYLWRIAAGLLLPCPPVPGRAPDEALQDCHALLLPGHSRSDPPALVRSTVPERGTPATARRHAATRPTVAICAG
ncbi:MAG: creatininase family protein, partial [Elioraea tepidiphila]